MPSIPPRHRWIAVLAAGLLVVALGAFVLISADAGPAPAQQPPASVVVDDDDTEHEIKVKIKHEGPRVRPSTTVPAPRMTLSKSTRPSSSGRTTVRKAR